MKKSEFKQCLVGKGMKSEEITVTINGAEKLDEVLIPVVLANMLVQASEDDKVACQLCNNLLPSFIFLSI